MGKWWANSGHWIQCRIISYKIDRVFDWPVHLALWRALFVRGRRLLYPPHVRERMRRERESVEGAK
jgi:hypothetical protein